MVCFPTNDGLVDCGCLYGERFCVDQEKKYSNTLRFVLYMPCALAHFDKFSNFQGFFLNDFAIYMVIVHAHQNVHNVVHPSRGGSTLNKI